MKNKLIPLLFLAVAAALHAVPINVTKTDNVGNAITAPLTFGTSQTLTIASGGSLIQQSGGTIASAAGTNLTVGTTTFGTAMTLNNSTGAANFLAGPSLAMFTNNFSNANTVGIRNNNTGGFSTLMFFDQSGVERGSIGVANSATSSPWGPNGFNIEGGTNITNQPIGLIVNTTLQAQITSTGFNILSGGGLFLLPVSGAGTITGSLSGLTINAAASGNADINLGSNGSGKIQITGTNKTAERIFNVSTTGFVRSEWADASGSALDVGVVGSGDAFISLGNAVNLQFKSNTAEVFRLTSTNNVLIGTTSDFGSGSGQLAVSSNQTIGGALSLTTAGKTVTIKSGANAAAGTFTMVAGSATVTSTAVTANMTVIPTLVTTGGTPGVYTPLVTVTAGSFTATSIATDTSTYNWVGLLKN